MKNTEPKDNRSFTMQCMEWNIQLYDRPWKEIKGMTKKTDIILLE